MVSVAFAFQTDFDVAIGSPRWSDGGEASTFLATVEATGDPMSPMWRLLLATGLRRDKLRGLKWDDVDLVGGYLSVVRSRGTSGLDTPRTKKGRRTISLDAETINALARWKDKHETAETTFGAW